jgi:hypothetical protein
MAPVRATRKEKEKITQNVEKKFTNSFNSQTSGETGLLLRFQPVGFTDRRVKPTARREPKSIENIK